MFFFFKNILVNWIPIINFLYYALRNLFVLTPQDKFLKTSLRSLENYHESENITFLMHQN